MKRLVLFDIDETIISSGGTGRRAISRVLQKEYLLDEEFGHINMSGKTDPQILKEIFEYLEKPHLYSLDNLATFFDHYLAALKDEVEQSEGFKVHDGVESLLIALSSRSNSYLGLVTGNLEKGARLKLDRAHLNQYFPIGAYGSDSANRLDLPAIAAERANRYYKQKFSPSEVVIIGDSVNDILCAKHYGAKCIAVNTGKTSWQELEVLNPEFLIKDLSNNEAVIAAIYSSTTEASPNNVGQRV